MFKTTVLKREGDPSQARIDMFKYFQSTGQRKSGNRKLKVDRENPQGGEFKRTDIYRLSAKIR
jgi:hypothetical protein